MAASMAESFLPEERVKFKQFSDKLNGLVFKDSDEFRAEVNFLIDQLNSLEYGLPIATHEAAAKMLCQVCMLVSAKYDHLLSKTCQLIGNVIAKLTVSLDQASLDLLVEYLVTAFKICKPWTIPDLLRALGAVLYENGGRISKIIFNLENDMVSSLREYSHREEPRSSKAVTFIFYDEVIGTRGLLTELIASSAHDEDLRKGAVQCIENICIRSTNTPFIPEPYVTNCLNIFITILQTPKQSTADEITYDRILISALRGLQNIIIGSKTVHLDHLGVLLAALKVHMFCGVVGQSSISAGCLYPSPMSQFEPVSPKSTTAATPTEEISLRPSKVPTKNASAKRNKKKKTNTKKTTTGAKDEEEDAGVSNVTSNMKTLNVNNTVGQASENSGSTGDVFGYSRHLISSSESEYSDTEGGQVSRLRSFQARVRQTALGCFNAVIKGTDRRVMFGYWTSFIPDALGSGSSQSHTLFTVILKDLVPKTRTAAIAALGSLLEGSKQYLAAADDSEQHKAAFTSYSVVLGLMIKEIHRCLLVALVAENSPLAITQIIKCLATLVPNVPYQKLKPGLLSRISKQIRPFISHRDPNVRVACLTCLGAIVTVQAPLMEVCHILLPSRPQSGRSTDTSASQGDRTDDHTQESSASPSSPGYSPRQSPGTLTPTFSDQALQKQATESSWVLKLCVRYVMPAVTSQTGSRLTLSQSGHQLQGVVEPLPVRLESLQVLQQMTKCYFMLTRNSLTILADVICGCLEDKEMAVQLHAAKLLEELGNSFLRYLQDNSDTGLRITAQEAFDVWIKMLSGPLPAVMQNMIHPPLRATGCDCLSNIGATVYDLLPMDKRILCITLLLGLTDDEDKNVKAAAVRALGVYMLYPTLREDISFVADAANATVTCMEDSNLVVRMKAAWSLANLSDALVMNRDAGDSAFVEDFSDMLLLKLLTVATKAAQDNDKVKSNAVRAIGNLLRYSPKRSLGKSIFFSAVEQAVDSLVKTVNTGAMKVRWNACYASGNVFRNALITTGHVKLTQPMFCALCAVVKDCKNFKVRINAALALSVPDERIMYGTPAQFTAVWDSLITALWNTETTTDFAEYRHRDSLVEQVCFTLIHLAALIDVQDLPNLHTTIIKSTDFVAHHTTKYHETLLAENEGTREKVLKLTKAADHIATLAQSPIQQKELSLVKNLQNIFSQEHPEPSEEAEAPKTSFRQTYD